MTHGAEPFPRPRVVVSQCLELAAVRYNGERIPMSFVRHLAAHVELVPVCPEVGMGLGVPRDPIRLERLDGQVTLRQPSTGRELTAVMRGFAEDFLAGIGPVDGFVLKTRSPSCGIGDVELFAGPEEEAPVVDATSGAFAAAVLRQFPDVAVEDEVGLADPARRHRWLTRIFALAGLRQSVPQGALPYPAALAAPDDDG